MTEQAMPQRRRARFGGVKIATAGLSLVAFVGAIVGVAKASPDAIARSAQASAPARTAAPTGAQAGSNSGSLQSQQPALQLQPLPQVPARQQAPALSLRPRTRTRGS